MNKTCEKERIAHRTQNTAYFSFILFYYYLGYDSITLDLNTLKNGGEAIFTQKLQCSLCKFDKELYKESSL